MKPIRGVPLISVGTRLTPDVLARVEKAAKEKDSDKSTVIREAVEAGIDVVAPKPTEPA